MTDDERRRFGPPAGDAPVADSASDEWTPEAGVSAVTDEWPSTPAPADDEDETPQVSWLGGLFGLRRRERLEWRVRQLDRAIAHTPDAPVNYVLRGEVRLKLRQRAEAADDFQTALALADRAFADSDWGLVAQALSDRALMGLRRAGYTVRRV